MIEVRAITNGQIPGRSGRGPETVHIANGRIDGISARKPRRGAAALNAHGAILLPGLVDLHCDAIEHQALPRPGGQLDPSLAFWEMDRQFATVGILTGFHAIGLLEASDLGLEHAQRLCAAIEHHRHETHLHHKLHLRCEITQPGIADAAEEIMETYAVRLLSIMDHSPGAGQFPTTPQYERFLVGRGLDDATVTRARRAAVPFESPTAREQAATTLAGARRTGAVTACHDDDGRMLTHFPHGIALSEFPLSLQAARSARDQGVAVSVGAPNVLRGRSSAGHLNAREAIRAGVVDALCSDYHPPSLLAAVFKLAAENVCSLREAVALASSGPSRIGQLPAAGTIAEGEPADIIVVDDRGGQVNVRHALIAGHCIASILTARTR